MKPFNRSNTSDRRFAGLRPARPRTGIHWVKPKVMAEVAFARLDGGWFTATRFISGNP